jgi:hypothetical protein
MGGIGGAMDLSACAKQVFVAMEHTTRDGQPRLLERCTLPVTNPFGVTLVVTELAVVRVADPKIPQGPAPPSAAATPCTIFAAGSTDPASVTPTVSSTASSALSRAAGGTSARVAKSANSCTPVRASDSTAISLPRSALGAIIATRFQARGHSQICLSVIIL